MISDQELMKKNEKKLFTCESLNCVKLKNLVKLSDIVNVQKIFLKDEETLMKI